MHISIYSRIIVITYLFKKTELILIVFAEIPGDYVYDGQHSSTKHSSSHSDWQQGIDNVDEEHCPPDALWCTVGGHADDPIYLHYNQYPDHKVAHNPHVILVEAVSIAHHHHRQENNHGHRQYWDVARSEAWLRLETVEGKHNNAHHHQNSH